MSAGVRTDYRGECERDEEVARQRFYEHWQSNHLERAEKQRSEQVPDA